MLHGKRRRVKICPRCRERLTRPNQGWCTECHAEYMRETRPKHSELGEEARKKANTRAYTNVLVRRGKLVRGPCKFCGTTEKVEAHHPDYNDPRTVDWVCKACHKEHYHPTEPQEPEPRKPIMLELVEGDDEEEDAPETELRTLHLRTVRRR